MNSFQDKNYTYFFENEKEFRLIYDEIFNHGCYNFELGNPQFIIDIGSHIGLSVLYFRSRYPQAKIISFEPDPSSFKIQKVNIDTNSLLNVELINKAVTNKSGETSLYIDHTDGWNSNASTIPKGWDNKQNLTEITVGSAGLGGLLDLKPDLIKMDIEGQEMSLIKNNVENLHKSKFLVIEFHQTEQRSLSKFLKLLRSAGFVVETIADPLDKNLIIVYARRMNVEYK